MAMTTKQASEKWGISDRRIRVLCAEGKIEGAELIGKTWYIPDTAIKTVTASIATIDIIPIITDIHHITLLVYI